MLYYRLYHMGHGDRIERCEDFVAPHDDAAKLFSQGMLARRPTELWQRARLVARFNPVAAGTNGITSARR